MFISPSSRRNTDKNSDTSKVNDGSRRSKRGDRDGEIKKEPSKFYVFTNLRVNKSNILLEQSSDRKLRMMRQARVRRNNDNGKNTSPCLITLLVL